MTFQALQDPDELAAFVALLKQEGVSSYLEIGSKWGGSLWPVGSAMPPGSKIVAVDLPMGTVAWSQTQNSLRTCTAELRALGHQVTLIWGDSTNPGVIKQVRELGSYDAVLIDANHTRSYLARDWSNYADICRIVAFHDISWKRAPDWKGTRIEVPQFWDDIKTSYKHTEIHLDKSGKNNGIGVLWRQ